MKEVIEKHWASYFYSGSVALIVSWVLLITMSGCRLGNHIDNGPETDIGVSGYYSTRPISYVASSTQTTGGSHQINLSVASVPTWISNYFTDPTTMVLDNSNATSGAYRVFQPGVDPNNPNNYQTVYVAANGKSFGYSAESGWQAFWTNNSCLMNISDTYIGNINPLASSDPSSVSSALGRIPLTGRLSVKITEEIAFQGNCTTTWQEMESCYQNVASCPGSNAADQANAQDVVLSIYRPWVQAGAISPNEINTTSDLRFDVSYQ
jgi:hypothetical protein